MKGMSLANLPKDGGNFVVMIITTEEKKRTMSPLRGLAEQKVSTILIST